MLRAWRCSVRRRRTALIPRWLNSYRLIISTSAETTAIFEGQEQEEQQEECNNNSNRENECQNERNSTKDFYYGSTDVSNSQEHHWERYNTREHRPNVELMKCQVVKGLNNHVKLCQEHWMEMEPQDKCTILYKLGLHALELIEYDKDVEEQEEQHYTTNIAQRIKSVYKELHIKWRSNKNFIKSENASIASDRVCVEEMCQETNSHSMEGHESQLEPEQEVLTYKIKEEICQNTCHNVNRLLPYVMRLKLSLSFAMWIATLRSAQLEFMSSKLPYAPTRRVNHTKSSPPTQKIQDTLAFVYPRYFFDKLINWSAEVVVRVNSHRNPTAVQAPAPHTWQSDVSELIQDEELQAYNKSYFENEQSITKHDNTKGKYGLLSNKRVAWHPFTHRRINNKQQILNNNKSATALISRRTRALRSAHKAPHRAGTDDSIWAITHAQYQRRARRHHDGLLFRERHEKAPWQSTRGWMKFIVSHQNPYRSISCVSNELSVESIHFDTNAMFDALFHGNYNREEGCPVNNHGTSTATPIFIKVNLESNNNTPHCEKVHVNKYQMLTHYCVMAHAAVLTSLFIEGRVAHFFTDNKDVYEYVIFVFQELIERQCLSVQLVEYVRTLNITPESVNDKCELEESNLRLDSSREDYNSFHSDAQREFVYLMSYYPDYAQPKLNSLQHSTSRHAIILVPPENRHYNKNVARQLARLILQAAPCTVIVQTEYEEQESAQKQQEEHEREEQNEEIRKENKCTRRYKNEYVKQICKEVNLLKAELSQKEECQIKWEALPMEMHMGKNTELERVEQMSKELRESNKQSIFKPKLQKKTQTKKLSFSGFINYLPSLLRSNICKYNHDTKNNKCKTLSVTSFLKALSESNALNHYYSLQFLTSSNRYAERKTLQKELYDFLYSKLPSNVRVVGINTSPFDILYYYPHAPFLQRKTGNSERYKAVDLAVISKSTSIYEPNSLKLEHASRYHKTDSDIFSSFYSLSDRTNLANIEYMENNKHIKTTNGRYGEDNTKNNNIHIKNAATIELIIQYLITGSPIKAVLAIITKILHL